MGWTPKRSLIVAIAQNGVIGRDGDLPWRLPEDLAYFRRHTLGHAVVMGRRTWESLPKGALKRRLNIVVSRQPDFTARGALVASSLEDAYALAATTALDGAEVAGVVVIGGAQLYAEALETAEELRITHVLADVDGDTYFPSVPWDRFEEVERVSHPADDRHAHPFEFALYRRR